MDFFIILNDLWGFPNYCHIPPMRSHPTLPSTSMRGGHTPFLPTSNRSSHMRSNSLYLIMPLTSMITFYPPFWMSPSNPTLTPSSPLPPPQKTNPFLWTNGMKNTARLSTANFGMHSPMLTPPNLASNIIVIVSFSTKRHICLSKNIYLIHLPYSLP